MSKKTSKHLGLQTVETIGAGKSPTPTLQTHLSASSGAAQTEPQSLQSLQTPRLQVSTLTGGQLLTTGEANDLQTAAKGKGIPISTVTETFLWAFRLLQTVKLLDIGVERDANEKPVCYMIRLQVSDGWTFATENGLQMKDPKAEEK